MDLDDVTLELRTREHVSVALTEFPLLESDLERAKAARRLIGHAGREIGAKIRNGARQAPARGVRVCGSRALAGRARRAHGTRVRTPEEI